MAGTSDMTVPQAARVLGCTAPTVRKLVDDGLLPAVAIQRGGRRHLTFASEDVTRFAQTNGTFSRRGRPRGSGQGPDEVGKLQSQIGALRSEIGAIRRLIEAQQTTKTRDADGQSEVVALAEAVQLQRAAIAALQEADEARSEAIQHLQRAMGALETADGSRRKAVRLLDEVVGAVTLPGDITGLERS